MNYYAAERTTPDGEFQPFPNTEPAPMSVRLSRLLSAREDYYRNVRNCTITPDGDDPKCAFFATDAQGRFVAEVRIMGVPRPKPDYHAPHNYPKREDDDWL